MLTHELNMWQKMTQDHLTEFPHMLFMQLPVHNSHNYTNLRCHANKNNTEATTTLY